MKTRTIFATLAVPATAVALFAQDNVTVLRAQKLADEGTMIAQGPAGVVRFAGATGANTFFTQEFSFNGSPVTGAPYSADEKTESIQTLADGTHITNTTSTRMYRDSQGRTRREMSLPSLAGDTQTRTMITISDPVSGVSYSLDPETKTAHQMPGMAMVAAAKLKAEAMMKDAPSLRTSDQVTGTTTVRTGGAFMSGPMTSEVRIVRSGSLAAGKHEDLGASVFEGISAKGSRETTTIEAGQMGNDRPITITSERWYSPDLQIEVKSVHNDPRTGETTHTVTNINRTEPDPSLFQVPSDYKQDEVKPKVGPEIHKFEFHQ
jgi:hypothetical protein